MAYVNSLKSIWEKTDSSYIHATKSGGRTSVSRRLFPQVSSESNLLNKSLQRAEYEYERNQPCKELQKAEDVSVSSSNHETLEEFDAIPEEFRPSKQGRDLLKISSSPKIEKSKPEKPTQNERFSNKPNATQRKGGTQNSISSNLQNIDRDGKERLKLESPQRDVDIFSNETGKPKSSEKFFYSYSSESELTSKGTKGCQQNCSEEESCRERTEKSKLKNTEEENRFRNGFCDSESSQSKATKHFEIHSSFEKHKEENNFNKFNKNMPPEFQYKNANNQYKYKDKTDFPKYDKDTPAKFQERNTNNPNRGSFEDEAAQEVTREITVERRIKWKNDLCEFKKPENKPNSFYEYTKTTKKSVRYVPSHCEDGNDDNETKKKTCHDFEAGREFRHKNFGSCKHRLGNQKDRRFDSTGSVQRREVKDFSRERIRNYSNKVEEKHDFFHCGNGRDPIVIKHEIKVIHVNQQGKNNRMFHSSRAFQPYNGRNGKVINNDPRGRNGKLITTDTRERKGKIINDPRERNDKMINANSRERNCSIIKRDVREYCGVKIEENTMTKTDECFQKTRKQYVRIPLKFPGSSSNANNDISRTANTENGAALIKYGRDMSDMIAGSYVAISSFLDNYEQWKDFRRVTMLLITEVEKNLSQSGTGKKRICDVAALVGAGCKAAQIVPHPGLSVAARVIAILSDIVVNIFSSSNSAKSIGMDDFQLRLSLQRDMEVTSDIYMYGMQCDFNFQQTCELIEKFHSEIQDGRFKEFEETFETRFLKEIFLLNPMNPAVFYKKLGKLYKLLNQHQQSEEGKAFCGAFEDWPDALTTISRLHHRFKTEKWDSLSVVKAWEEVYNLLQKDKLVVEDILRKIQDLICVLIQEQSIMERYVMDLERQC